MKGKVECFVAHNRGFSTAERAVNKIPSDKV